jgi:hypothetical protein
LVNYLLKAFSFLTFKSLLGSRPPAGARKTEARARQPPNSFFVCLFVEKKNGNGLSGPKTGTPAGRVLLQFMPCRGRNRAEHHHDNCMIYRAANAYHV